MALFEFLVIPDDRHFIPMDGASDDEAVAKSKLPITELFRPGVAKQTILLATMTGLNFFAYQAFTGRATTYLKEDRALPDTVVGDVVGGQFIGAAIGGLVWGFISDRFGRQNAAWGFVAAVAIIPVYLFVPMPIGPLELTGFTYGVMLSYSAIWGPWLSELYPPHLPSTAASIFNWGRVISMTGPFITAPLAESFGRAPVMSLASMIFLAAAIIWLRMPETVTKRM